MDKGIKTHVEEPGFQSQQSSKCDLLISVTDSVFSYLVVDMLHDQAKIYGSIGFKNLTDLESAIDETAILRFYYRKVKISIQTNLFAFIPQEVFDEGDAGRYAGFVGGGVTLTNAIKTASIKTVASFDTQLKEFLTKRFPSALILTQAEPFVEAALKFYSSESRQLFIGIAGEKFELLLTEGKKVIFYNLLPKHDADEFNYYILTIIKQLQINPKEVSVILSGEYDAEVIERLEKYFNEIHHVIAALVVNIPDDFKTIEQTRIFTLSALLLCE
ncbi:DUF3822 family protein [Pedobacter sp. HMF7647]|uniref:DUF3822 family protein n=1 Tax=Hufsiella arboris TaxID=2695275 RepID=A0A7K1Y7S8_9SPHI|nr:DUF3822 family protein [Hufsiella arboris]